MKKLFTLLAFCVLIVTCQAKELSLNLKADQVFKQFIKNQIELQLMLEGHQMTINANLDIVLEYLVKSVDDEAYDLQMSFRNFSGTINSDKFALSFDTASVQDNLLGQIISAFIDKPIAYKMSNKGKIIEIYDLGSLKLNMAGDTTLSKLMEKSMGANSGSFMQSVYPDKSVSVGDSWTNSIKVPDSDIEMLYTYIWKSSKGRKNLIEVNAEDINVDFSVPLKAEDETSVRIKINGKSTGLISLDKRTGWITASDNQFEAQCKLLIGPNPKMPEGAEIPISIKAVSTVRDSE